MGTTSVLFTQLDSRIRALILNGQVKLVLEKITRDLLLIDSNILDCYCSWKFMANRR